MSIFEDVENMRKQLAEEKEAEAKQTEIEEDDTEEEAEEEAEESSETEENKEDQDDKTLSVNQLAARLRIEQREKEALKRELEAAKNKPQKEEPKAATQENTDPEPDQDDIEAHLQWQLRKLAKEQQTLKEEIENRRKKEADEEIYNRAIYNFQRLENDFSQTVDDYADVSSFVLDKIKSGIQALNPYASDAEIGRAAYNQILTMAEHFASRGLNPVEELYGLGEVYGYKKQAKQQERKAPSIDKIAANRDKSVHSMTGGSGKSAKTNMDPSKMTLIDVMNLTQEERKAILKR